MSEKIYVVTEQEAGQRLDQFLKEASGLTRSEVQKWIKDGRALLADGKMIRPNYHVQTGDQISFSWEEKKELALIPQDIPLDILYEDEHMLVINKARGTTPEHIRKMTNRLAGRPVPVHGNPTQRALTSERASLTFGLDWTDRF